VLTNTGEEYQVRIQAARSLGLLGEDQGVKTFVREALQKDHQPEIQLIAAGILAELGDPTGYAVVKDRAHDSKSFLRGNAVNTLVKFHRFQGGNVQGIEINVLRDLIGALQQDSDPKVRELAALALGSLGDELAIDALLQATRDKDKRVQIAAKKAIQIIRDPRR
jgi:HEAT repeat protein